jgi:hypothetical protein
MEFDPKEKGILLDAMKNIAYLLAQINRTLSELLDLLAHVLLPKPRKPGK